MAAVPLETPAGAQAKADAAVESALEQVALTYVPRDELDSALAGKADLAHTHTAADITDLPAGIGELVEDTSPQLGGNLDLNGFTVGGADEADLTKLSELTATSTELNYVAGVTSSIQTQLNSKQNADTDLTAIAGLTSSGLVTRTGSGTAAARTITGTSGRITVTNGNGVSGNPTIDIGADVVVQDDLNSALAGKADSAHTHTASDVTDFAAATRAVTAVHVINAQTGTSYTAVATDAGKIVTLDNSSPITFTLPPNSSVAFAVGTRIDLIQTGEGQVTITPGPGVTVNGTPGTKLRAQHSAASVVKVATDTWQAIGDLAA